MAPWSEVHRGEMTVLRLEAPSEATLAGSLATSAEGAKRRAPRSEADFARSLVPSAEGADGTDGPDGAVVGGAPRRDDGAKVRGTVRGGNHRESGATCGGVPLGWQEGRPGCFQEFP